MSNLDVRTLLLVDDEEMMLEILKEILEPLGIRVVQALNPAEAFKVLAETKVTAIISDIRMPGASGLDFLEKLRGMGSTVPLVFLTASQEKAKIHRALQLGAVDFLEKPFEPEHLQDVVFKLLEIGVRQQEIERIQVQNLTLLQKPEEVRKNNEDAAKKGKLIQLLRIKLPWQKAK